MITVVERGNSPLQLVGVVMLFLIAIAGYIFFNAWHNTADADESLTETPAPEFKLNANQYGLINTQDPVILNSNTNANPSQP
jgi:hypothetical protein